MAAPATVNGADLLLYRSGAPQRPARYSQARVIEVGATMAWNIFSISPSLRNFTVP
jgi:hypothetical protein